MSAVRLHDSDAEARSVAALRRRGASSERAHAIVASRPARGLVDVGASVGAKAQALKRQLADLEAFHRSEGTFENTLAAEEKTRRDKAEADQAELLKNLAGRGIARKHAVFLAGVVPLQEPTDERLYALRMTRRWYASDRTLLVVCGIKGCGKTLAAAEAANRAGGRLVPARLMLRQGWYWDQVDKDGHPLRSPTLGVCQADLLTTPLLVIDDLGQESDKDRIATIEVVDTIVCFRCDAGRPTIITTNYRRTEHKDYANLRSARGADGKKAAEAAFAQTWDGYLSLARRAETIGARVVEYGAVLQCPDEDIRAQEAAERRAQR